MFRLTESCSGKWLKIFEMVVAATVVVLLFLQCLPTSNIPDSYAVQCQQIYPDIKHSTLYDFVMLSGTGNKWLKFVTFVATDHKPVGVGKTYKVVIDSNTFIFVAVDHQPGLYFALQNRNENDLLNLRVEIRFTDALCVQYPLPIDSTFKNTSRKTLQQRRCGTELSLKLYSLNDSFLFQNTVGAVFRYLLSRRLDHGLTNLAHILPHVE